MAKKKSRNAIWAILVCYFCKNTVSKGFVQKGIQNHTLDCDILCEMYWTYRQEMFVRHKGTTTIILCPCLKIWANQIWKISFFNQISIFKIIVKKKSLKRICKNNTFHSYLGTFGLKLNLLIVYILCKSHSLRFVRVRDAYTVCSVCWRAVFSPALLDAAQIQAYKLLYSIHICAEVNLWPLTSVHCDEYLRCQ